MKQLNKKLYSPLRGTTIDGAEDVIVNVTGSFGYDTIEAEEASEIVNQAAGHGGKHLARYF